MAIDQTSSPQSTAMPAIDNEFPTYRAISSAAVLSLVFGLGSVFAYASLWFVLLSATSVILGLVSLRNIKRLPDVLTGAGLARVGIGIGLLFGLTSVTRVVVQDVTINLDAGRFARTYIGVIKDQPTSMALWYQQPQEYRQAKSPDDLVEEMKKGRSQSGAGDAYQEASRPIQAIKDHLAKGKDAQLSYSQIESKAIDGMTTYANALLKVDVVPTKEHPETEQYALLEMVKRSDEWLIKEIRFPYTPRSSVATIQKKDDDGHGH